MKKITVVVLLVVVISAFLPFSVFAATRGDSAIYGPSEIVAGEKITLSFALDCVNTKGVQGALSYDSAVLTLESITSNLGDLWTFEAQAGTAPVYFVAYGNNGEALFGKTYLFTAVFTVKEVTASTMASASVRGITLTDGENSVFADGADYTATVIKRPENSLLLKSLSVEGAALSPSFSQNQFSYNVSVPYSVETLPVFAAARYSSAKVDIEAVKLVEGQITPVKITVSYNNENAVYTIYTYREKNAEYVPSSSVAVTELILSDGYVTPDFDDSYNDYTVEIPNSVTTFYVTPILENENAFWAVEGDGEVQVGKNNVKIVVTAESLSASRTINLVVTRLAEKSDTPEAQDGPSTGVFQPWLYVVIIAAIVIVVVLVVVLLSIGRKKDKK